MKHGVYSAVLLGIGLTLSAASQAGPRNAEQPEGLLTLVRDQTVESALFASTVAYLNENLPIRVRERRSDVSLAQRTAEAQLGLLSGMASEQMEAPSVAVALVREAVDIKERILLVREQNAGVVNLSRLQPEVRGAKDEATQFIRLVQKETLRTVGYLLGLSQCMNPRCAMSGYKLDPGQDVMGRNYCPACGAKLEEAVLGSGGSEDAEAVTE
ncbi:MAG: hypothetical protein QGH42_07565 [Kiritimatiellia bacterium]|nr:hypothetical protein [Kiritimatiellia bacterium]MDP7024081.1 hypothetical protein [Kiritimatiellia bacterium]